MTDQQLKLATDTIRALIDVLQQPVTNRNHVEKTELIEASEIVLGGLLKQ